MGPGFARPSNVAAQCDFIPKVKGASTMGIAGPEIVKAAIGVDIGKKELGGSRLHTEVTGMADLETASDEACLDVIKRFLSYFPSNASQAPPVLISGDPVERRDESLLSVIPESRTRAYDMKKIIGSIADLGSLFELKPSFARNILTILGRMNGRPVGFLANQPAFLAGIMDLNAVDKAARFISLCDASGLPLIFLVDTPGFFPGPASELSGLVRHSGKLMYEIGTSTETKISLVSRKAYGFGIDDIIDPRDTRPVLIRILETMPEGKQDFMPPKKHGIVPI
jgi:acetyl-CoA carboxylase carboxyltransferase component